MYIAWTLHAQAHAYFHTPCRILFSSLWEWSLAQSVVTSHCLKPSTGWTQLTWQDQQTTIKKSSKRKKNHRQLSFPSWLLEPCLDHWALYLRHLAAIAALWHILHCLVLPCFLETFTFKVGSSCSQLEIAFAHWTFLADLFGAVPNVASVEREARFKQWCER